VEVGQGKRSLESFSLLLDGASRKEAGKTAPACGLFLWDVKYRRPARDQTRGLSESNDTQG
jgi:tRNA U38,U39,U40 pseudouridine synthase TruA